MPTKFYMHNTRAAKVNGEMVMWIRRQYAAMRTYPSIRSGLNEQFGVLLSIQQITRIAKGESFAQLPLQPTDREIDWEMQANAHAMRGVPPPSQEAVAQSLAKFQALMAQEAQPRESVLEILERRNLGNDAPAPAPTPQGGVPSLEEIEARERAAMGVREGAGLEKLKAVELPLSREQRVERLLGELSEGPANGAALE